MVDVSKAFFSYSRHDKEFAQKLAKDLRAGGAAVWIDQLDIEPGQHWDTAIEQAVSDSSILLVVLSPDSIQSENVMDEVSYALEERKLVIPVLYRECKIPLRLRRVQYVDARTNYESGLSELLRMLHVEGQGADDSAAQRAAAAEQETAQADVAARARERAEAARLAEMRADQERNAREEAERRERERREQQAGKPQGAAARQASTADAGETVKAPPGKRRILWAIGGAFALICLIAWVASVISPHRTPVVNNPSKVDRQMDITSTEPVSTASARNGTTSGDTGPSLGQWLTEFLGAFEGPSVERLQPFFAGTVAPYFTMSSATWAQIAKDKQAYFDRFPQIQYRLGTWQHAPQSDGSEVVEYEVHYSVVRKDGVALNSVSQVWARVRVEDGQWKITGIRERKQ
jgi:hypothetical protein